MSILKAAQCHISKQLAHKSSNAFISLLDETSVLARARTADTERDSNGKVANVVVEALTAPER